MPKLQSLNAEKAVMKKYQTFGVCFTLPTQKTKTTKKNITPLLCYSNIDSIKFLKKAKIKGDKACGKIKGSYRISSSVIDAIKAGEIKLSLRSEKICIPKDDFNTLKKEFETFL